MANQSAFQPDSDVHITFEDQQRINKFARQNAKMEDLIEELKIKQNEVQTLQESWDEVVLAGSDRTVLSYYIGEVFICEGPDETECYVLEMKKKKEKEIEELKTEYTELKKMMAELKTQLYLKFGTRINLECEVE